MYLKFEIWSTEFRTKNIDSRTGIIDTSIKLVSKINASEMKFLHAVYLHIWVCYSIKDVWWLLEPNCPNNDRNSYAEKNQNQLVQSFHSSCLCRYVLLKSCTDVSNIMVFTLPTRQNLYHDISRGKGKIISWWSNI